MVVRVDQTRQHELAVATELLGAGIGAPQLVARAGRDDGAVADQHGAAGQRRRVGGAQQDVAVDEEAGHLRDASGSS